jgi:hypothetical protein
MFVCKRAVQYLTPSKNKFEVVVDAFICGFIP